MTPSNFLIRGLVAGLLAGLVAFGVAYVVGEPQVDAAIAIEEAGSASHHEHADPAAEHPAEHAAEEHTTEVSRANQSTWGLLTGTLGVGVALGGITSLVAALALGRIGRLSPAQSTSLVAALGYVSYSLVPFLKYPATPPAVGNPDTIGQRTELYFGFLAISLVAAVVAVFLGARLLKAGQSNYRATVIPALAFVAVVTIAGAILPTVNEVGAFPADTLWFFRRASLLTNATLWVTIGIVLTGLVGRLYARESAAQARRELAASL
jgi:predicted cobalt transporter CbtA